LVGAYIAYDMAVISQWGPDDIMPLVFAKYRQGEIRDIAITQKMIDYATRGHASTLGYGLESVARANGLEHPNKDSSWRIRFWGLRNLPIESWPVGAREYVLADADLPLRIAALQDRVEERCKTERGVPLFSHLVGEESYKEFVLHLTSAWGVRTDRGRSEAFRDALQDGLDASRDKLIEAGLVRKNGKRNTKAAAARMEAVCTEMGLPIPRTDTGAVGLDKEACSNTGDDLLMAYSEYSQATSLLARAEDLIAGSELPLQTRFNSLLETSRTSTSKPRPPVVGAQMQNFPRVIHRPGCRDKKCRGCAPGARECLQPRPGYVFIGGDLPTAELRSLSQFNIDTFGFSTMAEQINAGRDLHLWFGACVLGLSYEEALARAKEASLEEARQQAKPCNFGFPGGMGVANFIAYAWRTYRVRLSVARATELKEMWLAAFREMPRFFEHIGRLVDRGKETKDADGRVYKVALIQHHRTGRWRARVPYCAACNTQFQELTATAAARGLMEVSFRCYVDTQSALHGSRPVLYTHDEIVLEAPEDRYHDAAMELALVMAEKFNELHPDVPVKKVDAFAARIYSKKTKPVYGPDGRLALWVPETKIAA
jgi:hypothetical protein